MSLPLILFLIGIIGFILNRRNLILLLISIEIMLLAVTIIMLFAANKYNDINGQIFGIFIIIIAGAESAIGLAIIVGYYRLRGSLDLTKN